MAFKEAGTRSKRQGLQSASRAQRALERLTELAAEVCKATSAILVMNQDGMSRILTSTGRLDAPLSNKWSYDEALYEPEERVVQSDPAWLAKLKHQKIFLRTNVTYFVRMPVVITKDHTLAFLAWSEEAAEGARRPDEPTLDDILRAMAAEFDQISHLLTDPKACVTVAQSLAELVRRVETAEGATALLDRDLRFKAASVALGDLLRPGTRSNPLAGRLLAEIGVPAANAVELLCRRALRDRLSSPDFEIIVDRGEIGQGAYSVIASPVSPTDTKDYFLVVTVSEVTSLAGLEEALDRRVHARQTVPDEPTVEFLLGTLVERPAVRARNTISYLTVRSWRASMREFQIKALKALKLRPSPEFVGRAADELRDAVHSLVGAAAFRAVVPVPCGHSRSGECFSVHLARALAARLDLPMVKVFADQELPGSSHPRQNAERPPLALVQPISEPVLLVDDVATSGRHFEEAVALLRPHAGAVLPIAWIGGDAAEPPPPRSRRPQVDHPG